MCVLTSIFTNAGGICLDVARVFIGFVEGRRKQQRQFVVGPIATRLGERYNAANGICGRLQPRNC